MFCSHCYLFSEFADCVLFLLVYNLRVYLLCSVLIVIYAQSLLIVFCSHCYLYAEFADCVLFSLLSMLRVC